MEAKQTDGVVFESQKTKVEFPMWLNFIMSTLQEIVGSSVQKAERVFDYYQMVFEHGETINIMNDVTLSGVSKFEEFHEKILVSVLERDSDITFNFVNSISFKISLLPEAYHGPEAITLHRDGKPILVWN